MFKPFQQVHVDTDIKVLCNTLLEAAYLSKS